MNRATYVLLALLTCNAAGAVPRGEIIEVQPLTPEEREARRVQMAQDMAAWLPRLVGQFIFEGTVQFMKQADRSPEGNVSEVRGKGDCIAIGDGAGVQCVIHAFWDEEWTSQGNPVEGGVSFLGPASILYGLDINAAKIRYLMLNTNGIAESESGSVAGYTAKWIYETQCEADVMALCRRVTRLRAVPDGRFIQATIEIEQKSPMATGWGLVTSINFDMRRVPQLADQL